MPRILKHLPRKASVLIYALLIYALKGRGFQPRHKPRLQEPPTAGLPHHTYPRNARRPPNHPRRKRFTYKEKAGLRYAPARSPMSRSEYQLSANEQKSSGAPWSALSLSKGPAAFARRGIPRSCPGLDCAFLCALRESSDVLGGALPIRNYARPRAPLDFRPRFETQWQCQALPPRAPRIVPGLIT